MFEILFIFGVLGLFLGTCLEFLASLAAFPTILTATAAVPLLSWAAYLEMHRRFELGGMNTRRLPVPPEHFYWTLQRSWLRVALAWSGPLAVAAWAAAIRWPAGLVFDGPDLTGWITGLVAILSTSVFSACAAIYVRASHWFDRMAPWAIGVCRRSLYRLSENPDFLAPGNPGQRESEKTIY